LLSGLLTSAPAGCTHNYYYGVNPCAPAPTAVVPGSAVQYGSVCEVPTEVYGGSGSSVAGRSTLTAPVLGPARPPKVVVSEPNGGSGSRFSWHRSDSESNMVTTRVDGAVDTPSVTR
jgi:hypothetical protein